jgi:hypothetical protein
MSIAGIHEARPFATGFACLFAGASLAGGLPTDAPETLEEVQVQGWFDTLHGAPLSASQGVVGAAQIETRPIMRTGELLEVVPGLIVTQHSGDGKANQYFLRGFNLDHGTDLATSVDGVPVNMPTHGHGQGYTDINFLIPELVQTVQYRKGTYYAETGNFSAAGAVDVRLRSSLDAPMVLLEGGQHAFARAFAAASPAVGPGTLLLAVDFTEADGPWLLDQQLRRRNGLARFSMDGEGYGLALTAQAYDGRWRSTDQIPQRAVTAGDLDRFGTVDPTDGGDTSRYALSARLDSRLWGGRSMLLAYAIDYDLDLFSNFSYDTDALHGDQFEQLDRRRIYGGEWSQRFATRGRNALTVGVQARYDDIAAVGLYRTQQRIRWGTIREDAVRQGSVGAYASVDTRWTDKMRTVLGLRGDRFGFHVDSALAANSGRDSDFIASPKFSLIVGPWRETEFFFNAGRGFHSNDARGTTITVDPEDGQTPVDRVDALVPATGLDVGLRSAILPDMQLSLSLWRLTLDSELLFIGDAGNTEASRASVRQGMEAGLMWRPRSWLTLDADYAMSRSRFRGDDPAGDFIPGAVRNVASLGVAVQHPRGWFGGARFRHFGSAPLIEDGSVRSSATTLVNLEAGLQFGGRYRLAAAVYNLLGSRDSDITYFYASQLRGEAAPVDDIHFHPVEPRTLRMMLSARF